MNMVPVNKWLVNIVNMVPVSHCVFVPMPYGIDY